MKLAEKGDTFRRYTNNLHTTIEWYNRIRNTSRDVEFNLISSEIDVIDQLIAKGSEEYDWNSDGLWEYMTKLHDLVKNLQACIKATQTNITEIKNCMSVWRNIPLFERHHGSKKDSTLNLDDRIQRVNKRYDEIKQAATIVEDLLEKNRVLFNITDIDNNPNWNEYVNFIDKIIRDSLFYTIGCSLGYLSEHMDCENDLPPLFVIQMELKGKRKKIKIHQVLRNYV